jgi:RNA polymerase sigma factor (sigma-70 family)
MNSQMPDVSDMDLLRDYQRQGSEEAFAELVRRHVNLVYSAALRHAGIAAHAEEITQAVFVILARKAAGLRPDTILDAWLYETTRWTALSFLRGERRRQWREQEAYMQSTFRESTGDPVWHQLSPLLDEAMARLGKKTLKPWCCDFSRRKACAKLPRPCRSLKRRPKAGCIARWRSCTVILTDAA